MASLLFIDYMLVPEFSLVLSVRNFLELCFGKKSFGEEAKIRDNLTVAG
jgi:hypothetical protein